LEHSFLRTGNPACLAPKMLEEAAEATAALVARACTAQHFKYFHGFGGSYGALMAQKVGVSALRLGGMQPAWVLMIDPPPAGPCTRGFMQPGLILASQIVRLGREVVGLDASMDTLKLLIGCSDSEWTRAIDIAMGDAVDAGEAINADEDWSLAIVATEQLAEIGQAQMSSREIERTKRRMDVYRKCMLLWHLQEASPATYTRVDVGGIMLVTSTGRWNWFKQVYNTDAVDCLAAYGEVDTMVELDGDHTAAVQAVCTNRSPEVLAVVRSVLGSKV